MHPATKKFPPVSELTMSELTNIMDRAQERGSLLVWTAREKAAWHELMRRAEMVNYTPRDA